MEQVCLVDWILSIKMALGVMEYSPYEGLRASYLGLEQCKNDLAGTTFQPVHRGMENKKAFLSLKLLYSAGWIGIFPQSLRLLNPPADLT